MSGDMDGKHLLMSIWDYDLFQQPNLSTTCSKQRLLWDEDSSAYFSPRSVKSSVVPLSDSSNNKEEDDACCRRSSRNHVALSRAKTAKVLYNEMCRFDCDPYLLVTPFCFGAEGGVAAHMQQPFRVQVHPQCSLITEIHSHLSESEVIGLLAGRWDHLKNILFVQLPFPCISTSTIENNGSTDVEMDPEAEYKARQQAEAMGLQIVGWYHSHPKFKPNPSVIDIFNQQQYQSVMKEQPFIGLIISPYDKDCADGTALHQWFVVKRYEEDLSSGEVYMPVKIDIEVQGFERDIDPPALTEEILLQNLQYYSPNTFIEEEISDLSPISTVSDELKAIKSPESNSIKEEKEDEKLPPVKKQCKKSLSSPKEIPRSNSTITFDLTLNGEEEQFSPITISMGENISTTSSVKDGNVDTPTATSATISTDNDSGRRSGRAKKPSEALLLMMSQKDQVFNERLPSKATKEKLLKQQNVKKALLDTDTMSSSVKSSPSPTKPPKNPKTSTKSKQAVDANIIDHNVGATGKKRKLSVENPNKSVQPVAIDATSDNSIASKNEKSKKKTTKQEKSGPSMYNNIILSLIHPTLDSANEGRRLLLATPVELQYASMLFVAMGLYYSRFKRRVDITAPWKGKRKVDKVVETSLYWLSFFKPPQDQTSSSSNAIFQQFVNQMSLFLTACWSDYSGTTGKLKKIPPPVPIVT